MNRNTAIEKISSASAHARAQTAQAVGFLSPSPAPVLSPSIEKGLTEQQALWISFRSQATSDRMATRLLNESLALDPPLTEEIVSGWWSQESFCDLAAGVINAPTVSAFLRLADTLFPTAYRALHSLLSSKNHNAQGKGLELLFRLHGMLIDRVQHEAPEAIESIAESLRKLETTVTLEVYTAPKHDFSEGAWREVESADA